MTPRELIAEAWKITNHEKSLRRWGFAAAFFETFLDIKLLGYQAYFLFAYITEKKVGFFDDFDWLYSNVPFWFFLTILISFSLLLLVELIFPHLAAGAIIGLAAKSHKGEPVRGGLILAVHNFLPIFASHEFFVLASWSTALTLCSVVLRYTQGSIKYFMVGIIVAFWLLSNLLKFMASFTEQGIVIRQMGIFASIGRSFRLLISHLGHIVFLMLLLFIISIRVFINAIIVLVIPGVVIGVGVVLLHFLSPLVTYIIAGLLGMVLILVASYFFAYLHVFRRTVWTLAFLELNKQKDLHIIDGEDI